MELISIDKYLELPREQAYSRFLDEKNLKTLRVYILILIFINITGLIVNIANHGITIITGIIVLNLGALLFIRLKYKELFNLENIRRVSYYFLLAQLLITIILTAGTISLKGSGGVDPTVSQIESVQTPESKNKLKIEVSEADSFTEYIFLFGLSILFFRFSRNELLQLFLIAFTIPLAMEFLINRELTLDDDVPNLILSGVFFLIAITSDKRRRKKFTDQYDFYSRKNIENIRMRRELNYAREIQLSMLPGKNAKLGTLEISAVSFPATEVGGDYFDYFKISEDKIGLFICDVSGHGVASGLLLSGLRSCMHLILEDENNPKLVMEKLNRMIRKTQNRRMFVTAIFATIDIKQNRCTLFNAGHIPPYRVSGSSGEIFKIKKHGMALGAMDSIESESLSGEVNFDFNPGDKLIFFTDGVNEAVNKSSVEYDFENLEIFLNENSGKEPRELINSLVLDIKKFTGDIFQKDDMTILIAEKK